MNAGICGSWWHCRRRPPARRRSRAPAASWSRWRRVRTPGGTRRSPSRCPEPLKDGPRRHADAARRPPAGGRRPGPARATRPRVAWILDVPAGRRDSPLPARTGRSGDADQDGGHLHRRRQASAARGRRPAGAAIQRRRGRVAREGSSRITAAAGRSTRCSRRRAGSSATTSPPITPTSTPSSSPGSTPPSRAATSTSGTRRSRPGGSSTPRPWGRRAGRSSASSRSSSATTT